jgi:hypothetical protein
MTLAGKRNVSILVGICLSVLGSGAQPATDGNKDAVEAAVLAVDGEMTQAGEAVDPDRLFSYVLDTDRGSLIQNGLFMATRQEALDRMKSVMGGVSKLKYSWKRRYVTVLSPEVALLTAEGESTGTTAGGVTFTRPFAQTVVFVLRAGHWRVIHAHQSSQK